LGTLAGEYVCFHCLLTFTSAKVMIELQGVSR
jgi:hypothetical protein